MSRLFLSRAKETGNERAMEERKFSGLEGKQK
jgi:hypothetical protein